MFDTNWISFFECAPMYTVSSPDDIPFDSKPVRALQPWIPVLEARCKSSWQQNGA